jgi:dipeptidyl aminopeptidase/acylaminoacyl peptidase
MTVVVARPQGSTVASCKSLSTLSEAPPTTIRAAVWFAAALAVLVLVCAAPAGAARSSGIAAPPPGVGGRESLAPQLLLIHGGSFLFEDPNFEPLTRAAAIKAGFVPHYLHYPLGDLRGAITAARTEAHRLGERFPGRVYAYGASAGGTLAAILAGDGLVRAAVAKAPISDLLDWEWPLGRYGPDYYEQIGTDPAIRRRFSPLRRAALRPLLVIQGRNDQVVPPAMNEAFAAKFFRVHLWEVPGGHTTDRLRPYIVAQAMGWLSKFAG